MCVQGEDCWFCAENGGNQRRKWQCVAGVTQQLPYHTQWYQVNIPQIRQPLRQLHQHKSPSPPKNNPMSPILLLYTIQLTPIIHESTIKLIIKILLLPEIGVRNSENRTYIINIFVSYFAVDKIKIVGECYCVLCKYGDM